MLRYFDSTNKLIFVIFIVFVKEEKKKHEAIVWFEG